MQQEAIVHTEQISRKSELKYFQIPLPGTVKKIIGIEASVFLFTGGLVAPVYSEQNTGGSSGSGSGGSTNNNCPNPGSASVDTVTNDIITYNVRMQIFRIGAIVNPTFLYQCGVYSLTVSVTAVNGDTPSTIAAKLADAVNNISPDTWIQNGLDTQIYKPTGSADGDLLTLTVDMQHQFFASATGSCGNEPPPPPPAQYDLLFRINNNEKVGKLSLQSPDVTDIFFQADVFREDRSINFADFSYSPIEIGEWIRGRKRVATDVLITTASPILEAYYKDSWGEFYNADVSYQLNVYIWIEKQIQNG